MLTLIHRVRSLSIVIHDVDVVLSECEPDGKQKTELQDIASSCHQTLSDLEKTLDNYDELQTYSGNIDNSEESLEETQMGTTGHPGDSKSNHVECYIAQYMYCTDIRVLIHLSL